jgi:myo-inositol catabolism protein IolC
VIYEGFLEALAEGESASRSGILVDEEFGAGILRDASQRGIVTALSTEKSGSPEFIFEYGDDFAGHIEAIRPTFAKALVRFNPEGDAEMNGRQIERLRQLSEYCRGAGQRFLFELLVPATNTQKANAPDAGYYDREVRPGLMLQAIGILQNAGIEPDIWKIEGLDRREDCERLVEVARRDGRDEVGCIVLGRAADESKVIHWLKTAASVSGYIGFAIGRSTFWNAMVAYVAGDATRGQTSRMIADRFREWTNVFEGSRSLA